MGETKCVVGDGILAPFQLILVITIRWQETIKKKIERTFIFGSDDPHYITCTTLDISIIFWFHYYQGGYSFSFWKRVKSFSDSHAWLSHNLHM